MKHTKLQNLLSRLFLTAAILPAANVTEAKVKLPSVISSGMVLQQQSDVKLWGTAKAKTAVIVKVSWDGSTYRATSDSDGRWALRVKTPAAGGPYTIDISDGEQTVLDNILSGEVWLCSGQSNMDMRVAGRYGDPVLGSLDAVVTSKNTAIRMFTVGSKMDNKPHDDCAGSWQEASPETVPEFSATAYFFARKLNEVLGVPVGILHASYGGSRVEAWMSNEAAAPYRQMEEVQNSTILYNGMMSPLVGYGIRGCLWYQGEANVDYPDLYTRLLPDMVSDWRGKWGVGEFPFYYAQIAPFNYNKGEGKGKNSAYLREAQVKCLGLIPSSGMITLTDIGDARTIHPMEKQTVGRRFAYMALERTYGIRGIESAAPAYKDIARDGGKLVISFDNTGKGLTSFRRPLLNFEVAGADKVFHAASARFGRDMKTVEVSSPEVPDPVAVRYGFKDYFEGSLFSLWGIPVSSFRSDDW